MAEGRPQLALQETLLIVADQTGQIVPRDFVGLPEEPFALPIEQFALERNLHLQNAITHLAARNQAQGFLSFDGPAEWYGERAETMRSNMQKKLESETAAAKEEFARATGHYALLEAGYPEQEVKAVTRSLFSDFIKKYGGARHYVEAQAYRRELADRVEASLAGRNYEPLEPAPETAAAKKELPQLQLLERLEVIQEDPRAGFLPATRQEANHVFAWLDESDIGRQVLEAHDHRQKPAGGNGSWRDGLRTVESMFYIVDDYLTNAAGSHEALSDLQARLADVPNHTVTLAEEIDETHPAFAVLTRFRDIKEFRQTGTVSGLKRQPMRTRTDRWTREGNGPHKRIEDQYTAGEPKPDFKKRIKDFPSSLTIHEARGLINEALDNEEKRSNFMIDQIIAVRKSLTHRRLFSNIVGIADTTLMQKRRVS